MRERAEATLKFLNLAHVADELAGNLSGGQKKLLEIGRTMHSWSLDQSLQLVAAEGRGVVVLLNCGESGAQLLAQFEGTAKASHAPERGRMDLRSYGIGAQILRDCGVHKMRLMGNPRRMPSMTGYGLEIAGYINKP